MDRDRRGFLIVTASALAASLAQWATAAPAVAADGHGTRIDTEAADFFDIRLQALRHLDDTVGAGQVYDAALLELRIITNLLNSASYSTKTGRRLFGCAAEAARLAGWCAYDAGRHAASERHSLTSLRASASAADPHPRRDHPRLLGEPPLQRRRPPRRPPPHRRSAHRPPQDHLTPRRRDAPRPRRPRPLQSRRAHPGLAQDRRRVHRLRQSADARRRSGIDVLDQPRRTPPGRRQPALTLGEPKRALEHFTAALTHDDPYDTRREVRGTAIYLARQAEAHLALGDIDAALDTGHQVITAMGGVDSARTASTLAELRQGLGSHRHISAVRDFLDYAA